MKRLLYTVIMLIFFSLLIKAQSTAIVMNEIYSRGTTTEPDWIELYNNSNVDIDLSAYKIYDSGGQSGSKDKKSFPAGTVIAAKGFYVVTTDGSEATDFGLSNSGEEVWLEDGTGAIIDDVTFPALATGETYARVPDGSSTWSIVTTYTKGKSNGNGTGIDKLSETPKSFSLNQNYPNPFNPSTMIEYNLPSESFVELNIFNSLGELIDKIVNERQTAGTYKVNWNAGSYSSGLYFYQIKSGNVSLTKKMLLVK